MSQHPTEETLNITRKFLGGELGTPGQAPGGGQGVLETPQPGTINPPPRVKRGLPVQAAPIAGQRAFGQQGGQQRRQNLIAPIPAAGGSLSDRFLDMPGPVNFARTAQGQAILQRILSGGRRRF